MSVCFLLLGTNLGDRPDNLKTASRLVSARIGQILTKSSIYVTAAWGIEDQEDFLNQVLRIETTLPVDELMKACLEIEQEMGRVRKVKWGERLIDIDILYYDDLVLESEQVTVPHPAIQDRRFTLVPLVEIASDYIHPNFGVSQQQLLDQCTDSLGVTKFNT